MRSKAITWADMDEEGYADKRFQVSLGGERRWVVGWDNGTGTLFASQYHTLGEGDDRITPVEIPAAVVGEFGAIYRVYPLPTEEGAIIATFCEDGIVRDTYTLIGEEWYDAYGIVASPEFLDTIEWIELAEKEA